jgi:superfamily II DNA helicase RecQ
MPTGGEDLYLSAASVVQSGLSVIIISPLLSLIQDQVQC